MGRGHKHSHPHRSRWSATAPSAQPARDPHPSCPSPSGHRQRLAVPWGDLLSRPECGSVPRDQLTANWGNGATFCLESSFLPPRLPPPGPLLGGASSVPGTRTRELHKVHGKMESKDKFGFKKIRIHAACSYYTFSSDSEEPSSALRDGLGTAACFMLASPDARKLC